MKEVAFRSIIFLIFASLVILIFSQGWLLYKQYLYTEKIFQDKVENLLFKIQQQVEKSITPDTRKPYENPNFISLNVPQKSFYAQFVFIEDYAHPRMIDYSADERLIQKRGTQVKKMFEELVNTSSGIDTLERIVVKYMQGKKTIPEDMNATDFIDVEAILAELMKNSRIVIPYDFGIKDLNEQWLFTSFKADTTALANSAYTIPILSESEIFHLSFPRKFDYFIQDLTFYIWITTLTLLFVFSSFWYILSVVLKQKKLSELKTDFINNMTHEFKTPIATIAFATANIENKKVIQQPEEILKFTQVIKKENKRMNRQVEQVLQAATIDRKALELNWTAVDMHDVIHQISDTIGIKIYPRNGTLNYQLDASQSIVHGDRTHLSNVIANLLDNAQKYSPEKPQITVTTSNKNGFIRISVMDKGKGLSEEAKEKIFEKFYRVPMGNLHNVKGFGLGLSYSKAIIEQHGGQISLTSKLHKGSTFTIVLPIKS